MQLSTHFKSEGKRRPRLQPLGSALSGSLKRDEKEKTVGDRKIGARGERENIMLSCAKKSGRKRVFKERKEKSSREKNRGHDRKNKSSKKGDRFWERNEMEKKTSDAKQSGVQKGPAFKIPGLKVRSFAILKIS